LLFSSIQYNKDANNASKPVTLTAVYKVDWDMLLFLVKAGWLEHIYEYLRKLMRERVMPLQRDGAFFLQTLPLLAIDYSSLSSLPKLR
jgi:hypothetical protein